MANNKATYRNKTLLIVDDEPSMRSTLSEILVNEGYRVHCAGSGEEALDLCRTVLPQIVLMDVRMPGIDGVETFRRIRRHQEGVGVILMSAYSTESLKEVALEEGAIAFLPKPLDLQKVVALVEEATETTILVVSEEPDSIQSVRDQLEQRGYRLTVVPSAHQALEVVEQIRFDLIFLDTQLSSMNGLELYLAIKKITPTSVAIMITGMEEEFEQVARAAVKRNAYTMVQKPLDIDHVLALLKRLTSQHASDCLHKPPLDDTSI